MTDSTHILGKDATLHDSIARMQQQLQHLGFHIEEHSWLNPIPHVWSVHIRDKDCPLLFTNGKGASKSAALASALGEFFERLNCNYFFADFYLGEQIAQADFVHYPNEKWLAVEAISEDDQTWRHTLLDDSLWQYYDPQQQLQPTDLIDTNSGNQERGICALPYQRQSDQHSVYFPVNIIANLYVSNGMSAGNTASEARVQALSEIFERWVKFKVIAEEICLPDIPDKVLNRYPNILAGIEELKAAGYGILVKDASLGGQYPVINVTLLNAEDQGCFASFGAHPCFEVALERTLTELLQGRSLESLTGFAQASFDQEEISAAHNLETHFIDSSGVISWQFLANSPDYAFADWNFSGTTQQEFEHLCAILQAEGKQIYISDYQHLGVYGCRIIVPDCSEIYHPEDLQWDNNNAGIAYRESIFSLQKLSKQQLATLLEQLNYAGFDDQHPIAALLGLAPDPQSKWTTLRMGELKTRLALAIHDQEAILQGCDWIKYNGQLSADAAQIYHCIETLVRLENTNDYLDKLQQLYGTTCLTQAQIWLKGEQVFDDLVMPTLALEGCEMHQKLLMAYHELQLAKVG